MKKSVPNLSATKSPSFFSCSVVRSPSGSAVRTTGIGVRVRTREDAHQNKTRRHGAGSNALPPLAPRPQEMEGTLHSDRRPNPAAALTSKRDRALYLKLKNKGIPFCEREKEATTNNQLDIPKIPSAREERVAVQHTKARTCGRGGQPTLALCF